jgi:hypothetical protein
MVLFATTRSRCELALRWRSESKLRGAQPAKRLDRRRHIARKRASLSPIYIEHRSSNSFASPLRFGLVSGTIIG